MMSSNEASGSRKEEPFSFKVADLVLVKWGDGMVYFAKIKKVDYKRSKCIVVFDDKSQDEADFDQIHSVDETTTDIICIKCKRDDSDAPNEIVLCDTCGIGFHQRCHVPPIPVSALELDMPWNCTYCQKGSKCPFLTESLDVLQNLLLDDEQSRDGDEESVMTVDSDQDEYGTTKSIRHKKRKGRRAVGIRRKRGFQKAHSPEKLAPKMAPPSADVWRHKLASTDRSQASSEQKDIESFSEGSPSTTEIVGKKRRKPHTSEGSRKRQKRASVESHTVSVTRLSVPICEESSTSTDQEQSYDSITLSDTEANPPQAVESLPPIVEEPLNKRPRSLRVSLSLPEEVESESPIGKVVKASHKFKTPEFTPPTTLPTWEEIATVTVQPKISLVTSPSPALTSAPRQATAVLSPTGIGSTVELPTAPLVSKSKGASPVLSPTGVIQLPTDSPLLVGSPKHREVIGQKRKLSDPVATSKAVSPPKQRATAVPSPSLSPNSDDVFEQSAAVVVSIKEQSRDSSPHTVIQLSPPTAIPPIGQKAANIQPYQAAIPKVGPLAPKPELAKPMFRPIAPKVETPVITKVVARVVTPHTSANSHSTPPLSVVAMTASPIPKPSTTATSSPSVVTVSTVVPRSASTPVSRIAKTATLQQTTPSPVSRAPTIAKTATLQQTTPSPVSRVPTIAKTAALQQTIPSPVSRAPTIAKTAILQQTIPSPVSRAPTIAKTATLQQTIPSPVSRAPTIAKTAILQQTIPSPVSRAPTIAKTAILQQTIPSPVSRAPTIAKTAALQQTIPSPVSRAPTIAKTATLQQTIPSPVSRAPTIAKTATLQQTIPSPVSRAPTIAKTATLQQTIPSPVSRAPTIAKTATLQQTIPSPVSRAPTIAKTATLQQTISSPVSRATTIAKTATTPLYQTTPSQHGVITSAPVKCTSEPTVQEKMPDKQRPTTLATPQSHQVTSQGKSSTVVTMTTTPATKALGQPKPHLIKNGSEVSPQRSPNKQPSPSHTPLQTFVSSAMNTALASTMASINNGNSPEPEVVQAMTRPTPTTIIARAVDSPDVIITGIETKPKPTLPPEVQRPPPPAQSAVYSRQQQRPQDLYHGRTKTSDAKPKKVIAKTVEIQSLPPPPSRSLVPTQSMQATAGAIVTPIASQTPMSVVQAVVVAPPTAYSQSAQDSSQTYYIPAVSQEGQHVIYAVPANTTTGSSAFAIPQATQLHHHIIQEPTLKHMHPPPPYRPPLTATNVVTAPGTKGHVLPPYTIPAQRAAVSPQVQQQTNVVYYTTGGVPSSGRGTPVNTTKPYAIVAALPAAADSMGNIEYRIPVSQQTSDIQYITTPAPQILPQHTEKLAQAQDVTYAYSYKKPSSVLLKTPTLPTPRPSAPTVTPQSQESGHDDDIASHLQTISKKIGTAFAQFSEEMLIGAFEDAWKKFQANGRKYEALTRLENSSTRSSASPSSTIKANYPPNAEVISTPGISPKLSLVRPAHSRPKPIAPKPAIQTATPTAMTPQAVASIPSGQQQYIYTYNASASQPQVIIQPVNSDYAIYTAAVAQASQKQKTYQVQTSGLYYPATASEGGSKVDMASAAAVITPKQVVNTQLAAPQQVPKVSPQRVVTARPTQSTTTPLQHQPPRRTSTLPRRRTSSKSIRLCALCGKEATYLCSGCHAEWYCGRECQLQAWDKHSDHCKA